MLNSKDLKTKGFSIAEGIATIDDLMELAKSIGKIIPHPSGESIAKLKSSDGSKSLEGTFSKRFGLSEFPFHTDTAFWSVPARYILMGMFNPSESATTCIPGEYIKRALRGALLKKALGSIYLISTFEGSKYTSLYFQMNGEAGLRFDPNVMIPVNKTAKLFHKEFVEIIKSVNHSEIEWSGNRAVVIDNWKTLHGRAAALSKQRSIYRVYLEGK